MKINQLPIKSIEEKHLAPHLLRKIKGGGTNTLILDDNETLYKEVFVVKAVTTESENILSFPSVIDGVALNNGDLVALVVQIDLSENGVYVYDSGVVTRIYSDFVVEIFVDENRNRVWYLTLSGRQIGDDLVYDYIKDTDNKVAVSSSDTAGYLIDKLESSDSSISIVDNGSTVDLTTLGGGSLPAGTLNQTLRHNGTTWEANDILKVSDSTTKSVGVVGLRSNNACFNVQNDAVNGVGTDTYLINTPNTYSSNRTAFRNFIANGNGILQNLGYSMTDPDVSTSAYHLSLLTRQSGVNTEVGRISHDGTISSKPLANASNYLLKANSSGEIVLSTDTEGGGGSLPSGSNNQTLRHNGTTWEASSLLSNTTDNIVIDGDFGNYLLNVENAHTNGSAIYAENNSNGFAAVGIKNLGNGKLLTAMNTSGEVANIDNNGNITSVPLANASNYLLKANSSGEIVLSSDTEGGGSSLPAGSLDDTLRHDGTNWVANSEFTSDVNGNITSVPLANVDSQLVYADTNGTLKLSAITPDSIQDEKTTVISAKVDTLPSDVDNPLSWKTYETILLGAGTYKVNIRMFLNTDSSNPSTDFFKANFRFLETTSGQITSCLVHRIAGGASVEPADTGNIFDISIPHQHVGMSVYPRVTILQQPTATMLDLTAIIVSTGTASINVDFKSFIGAPYQLFLLDGGYKEVTKL